MGLARADAGGGGGGGVDGDDDDDAVLLSLDFAVGDEEVEAEGSACD